MSKYYKAENVINCVADVLAEEANMRGFKPQSTDYFQDKACGVLQDLPTIEVSEGVIGHGSGDIDWQAVISTGQDIYAKGYEDGKKSVEVSEDAISKHDIWRIIEDNAYWVTYNETSKEKGMTLTGINQALNECPPVAPKSKEVIYGNEHNCIMTLFGECSYSETGCGDCAVVEKVRDALAKTQMKRQKRVEWIPCSERLPKDLEVVNITWINHRPMTYYADIKDKPFTSTAIYYKDKWWWYSPICEDMLAEYGKSECDKMDADIEVTAWMPLPKPWKGADDE